MGFGTWVSDNIFNLLTGGIAIVSLWFAGISLRSETKTRRIANLLSITANHRQIGEILLENNDLMRVYDPAADTAKQAITMRERVYVNFIIQQTNSSYWAMNDQLVIKLEGLRRDVAEFFSLPIPSQLWEKLKPFQNDEFVAFVESCRNRT